MASGSRGIYANGHKLTPRSRAPRRPSRRRRRLREVPAAASRRGAPAGRPSLAVRIAGDGVANYYRSVAAGSQQQGRVRSMVQFRAQNKAKLVHCSARLISEQHCTQDHRCVCSGLGNCGLAAAQEDTSKGRILDRRGKFVQKSGSGDGSRRRLRRPALRRRDGPSAMAVFVMTLSCSAVSRDGESHLEGRTLPWRRRHTLWRTMRVGRSRPRLNAWPATSLWL